MIRAITSFANGAKKPAWVTDRTIREVTQGGGAFTHSQAYTEPELIVTSAVRLGDRAVSICKVSYNFMSPVGDDAESICVFNNFSDSYVRIDFAIDNGHPKLLAVL